MHYYATTPRLVARVLIALALATPLTTSACGGSAPAEGTTPQDESRQAADVPLDESAPQGEDVAVLFTAVATSAEDADPPQVRLSVLLTDETGASVEVALVETIGTCHTPEPAPGAVTAIQCWWAGGGVRLHARGVGGELVIDREELDESTSEDPTQAVVIHRFALAAGARLVATPSPL